MLIKQIYPLAYELDEFESFQKKFEQIKEHLNDRNNDWHLIVDKRLVGCYKETGLGWPEKLIGEVVHAHNLRENVYLEITLFFDRRGEDSMIKKNMVQIVFEYFAPTEESAERQGLPLCVKNLLTVIGKVEE